MPLMFQVIICTAHDGTRTKRPAVDEVPVRLFVHKMTVPLGVAKQQLFTLFQFTQTFSCQRLMQSCCLHATLFFMRTGATIL